MMKWYNMHEIELVLLVDIHECLSQLFQRDIHRVRCSTHDALHLLGQHPLAIPHTVLRIGKPVRSLSFQFEAIAGEMVRSSHKRWLRNVVDSRAHEMGEEFVRLEVPSVFREDGMQEGWLGPERGVVPLVPRSSSPL